MIEVKFNFPTELDIAFWYLDKQFQRFKDEGVIFPNHEISFSEDEISILLWYPDDDDENRGDDGGGGDDPLWPLPKDPIPTLTYSITGYLPSFDTYEE